MVGLLLRHFPKLVGPCWLIQTENRWSPGSETRAGQVDLGPYEIYEDVLQYVAICCNMLHMKWLLGICALIMARERRHPGVVPTFGKPCGKRWHPNEDLQLLHSLLVWTTLETPFATKSVYGGLSVRWPASNWRVSALQGQVSTTFQLCLLMEDICPWFEWFLAAMASQHFRSFSCFSFSHFSHFSPSGMTCQGRATSHR